MVKKEYFRTREDGVRLYRSYSDQNLYIQKLGTGENYAEAIDVENSWFFYEETDRPIEQE